MHERGRANNDHNIRAAEYTLNDDVEPKLRARTTTTQQTGAQLTGGASLNDQSRGRMEHAQGSQIWNELQALPGVSAITESPWSARAGTRRVQVVVQGGSRKPKQIGVKPSDTAQ